LEALAKERQVEIEIDLPAAPMMIAGDREELLRLFENLIENALKYGASGGRVIVSLTQATSGAMKVSVSHRYPLAHARRAHEDLAARRTTGKLMLIPGR